MILMCLSDDGKTPKIKGECVVDGYKGWITLHGADFSATRSGAGFSGGEHRRMGETYMSEVSMAKDADSSSAELFAMAASGDVAVKKATILWLEEGGKDKAKDIRLKLELEDPMVISYSIGGDPASESFAVSYTKLHIQPGKFDGKAWSLLSEKIYDAKTCKLV